MRLPRQRCQRRAAERSAIASESEPADRRGLERDGADATARTAEGDRPGMPELPNQRAQAGLGRLRLLREELVSRIARIESMGIQTIRSVINPDKLRHLGPLADVRGILRARRDERARCSS
jgi:hypothetical protein